MARPSSFFQLGGGVGQVIQAAFEDLLGHDIQLGVRLAVAAAHLDGVLLRAMVKQGVANGFRRLELEVEPRCAVSKIYSLFRGRSAGGAGRIRWRHEAASR
jgi:hypothetical protein